MFGLDSVIDNVQSGKKMFVTTFVSNEAVAKALNGFVDAQTAYTKAAVKAGTDAATVLGDEATKAIQQVAKFDYSKLFSGYPVKK